jgi:antitoxin Phd
MDIKIDSLIPYEMLSTNQKYVFSMVEKNGEVLLLKDNKPAYIIIKYNQEKLMKNERTNEIEKTYTLHDAMRLVLSEKEDHTMHAAKLADEIYERKLYCQKDGNKAHYTQIRARCGHYPKYFEVLTGNNIRLKGGK